MLDGIVVDTFKVGEKFAALDDNGNFEVFRTEKKTQLYRSQTVSSLGLYNSSRNLQGAKSYFMNRLQRHGKIISENSFYHSFRKGIYNDIIYLDMKAYYPTIFEQIANHIDENYFGKARNLSKIARRIEINRMRKAGVKVSDEASHKPIVPITDIAENAIKPDYADHSEFIRKIRDLSNSKFIDDMDARVSKMTRNALVFGFGYQQKNAKISNISALVMFFGREILKNVISQIKEISGLETIFSHTDSVMLPHFSTKELDQAIRTACGLVDAQYFGNTEIISLGLNNIGIKAKWEDIIIMNQNSYIGSTIAPQGKRNIQIKIAGINTTSECSLGIDKQGNNIQDILNDKLSEVFSFNPISDEDKEFLYGLLKYRVENTYQNRLAELWRTNNYKRLSEKAIVVSSTIKHINYLKMSR